MENKSFFITTPIYYVNDKPHIGHAYTTIAADVLARYYSLQGKSVKFLTGTDEHGAKIAQAAERAGKSPQEFADEVSDLYKKTWRELNVDYSQFIRTTDPRHEKIAQGLIAKLKEKGLVEKRKYDGLYCIGCEKFLQKSDLVDGKCPDHKTVPVKQSEENYFFLLSKFQDRLIKIIKRGELKILPASRKNEVLGKLQSGLEDVSISRAAVKWGIPFPDDPEQTIYVWVEALINYYSATHIFSGWQKWEQHPADLHIIGKDILWFHAVIWPAMLLALELPLPKAIFAHGYFTVGGEKMSKTLGNVLDPVALSKKYGADALRYALLREFPFGEDGDISESKINQRYERDLANELGNLLQRVLVMIKKYDIYPERHLRGDEPVPPARRSFSEGGSVVEGVVSSEVKEVSEGVIHLRFESALQSVWKLLSEGNETIDKEKPWVLAKTNPKKLAEVLNKEYDRLFIVADMLKPFMPSTAEKISNQLKTLSPSPLFPRL